MERFDPNVVLHRISKLCMIKTLSIEAIHGRRVKSGKERLFLHNTLELREKMMGNLLLVGAKKKHTQSYLNIREKEKDEVV